MEMIVGIALCKLRPNIDFTHNEVNGIGPDFWVGNSVLIEVKNWSGKYFVTPKMLQEEVIERFRVSDPSHMKVWVVVAGRFKIGEASTRILRENGIVLIELGYQVKDNRRKTVRKAVHLLGWTLKRIWRLFTSSKLHSLKPSRSLKQGPKPPEEFTYITHISSRTQLRSPNLLRIWDEFLMHFKRNLAHWSTGITAILSLMGLHEMLGGWKHED